MRVSVFLFFVFLSLSATAEYRVFSLVILNKDRTLTRQIETTLDPRQYITLYPLNTGETIAYVDTWMCKGRTDHLKPHCENPKNLSLSENSSLNRAPAGQ